MNYSRPIAVLLFDLAVAPLILLGIEYALHYFKDELKGCARR